MLVLNTRSISHKSELTSSEMIEEVLTAHLFANQVRNSYLKRWPSVWIAKLSEMFASSHRNLASLCSGNHHQRVQWNKV